MVALGALGFLIFLWVGEGPDSGKDASSFWRWIILGQRLTQAITVLTLVLRVVLAAQVSVCTSLVAAIVLEKHSIPLFRAAEVSLLRSANDGPLRLTWILLKSGPRSAVLPKAAITLLLLLFVALQFSSTILVSDLGYGSIVGSPVDVAMGTGMTDETTHQSGFPNVFAYSPVPIPFGEIRVPPADPVVQTTSTSVSDTGLVRRVFPPFSAENITSVHSYTGNAITMSSRYVCMPPSLGGLHVQPRVGAGNDSMSVSMIGRISFNKSFTEAGLDFPADCPDGSCFTRAANFNCSLPYIPDGSASVGLASAFCLPHGVDALGFPDSFTIADSPVSNISQIFLVYRNNSTLSTWNQTAVGANVTRRLPLSQGAGSAEWGNYYSRDNGCWVQVSLCFQQLEYEFYDVHISSNANLDVPSLTWDSKTYEWNTTALESQYGVLNDSATPSERGLFVVNSIMNGTKSAMAWCLIKELVTLIYSYPQPNNVSFFASPFAQGRTNADLANRLHAVLDHVIKDSDSPALAMQSLLTALTASALSNILALFDNVHNVTVQSSASVLVPRQLHGLTAVAVAVVTLLVTNIAITIIYLAGTRYSNRGNYWSAVAQIVSDDTRDIFTWAPLRSDSQVRNELKAGGRFDMRLDSSLRLEKLVHAEVEKPISARTRRQNVQDQNLPQPLNKDMTRRTW